MKIQKKKNKKMLTHEKIYKIMQWLPVVVASVFFLINALKGNTSAMIAIGICLAVFIGVFVTINVKKVSLYKKEYVLAVALPTLVFIISLYSGASYSDDFPLYLAVLAMTGMFLEPQFTKMQVLLVDIFLVLMYVVHPEKSGGLSQYILCGACFTLAAILFYQVIKRGRGFIEISQEQAKESETLLTSIRSMGQELQDDFAVSSARIETSTKGLQRESAAIAQGAGLVSDSCNVVQGRIQDTKEQILQLNNGVKQFEMALGENKNNMEAMNRQVDAVGEIISQSGAVFRDMEEQMNRVAGIAKQISDISFNLTILSINAAVEAARAGEAGAGFEVLAAEMRALSENSTAFSNQVSDVVKEVLEGVAKTSERFSGSEEAFSQSEKSMSELANSFEKLNHQFGELYGNIECQNRNVSQIDYIFAELNQKVADMHSSSLANQDAVTEIADAMTVFSGNVGEIVKNTQSV